MLQRWAARYTFHWEPLFTYQRRRDDLAEWVDSNLDVKAHLTDDSDLGLAVTHSALRVIVSRTELDISVGTTEAGFDDTGTLLTQVFKFLQPKGFHLAGVRTVNTYAFSGDYTSGCNRLAKTVAGDLGTAGTPVDCAITVDVKTASSVSQVEYGIVEKDEASARLREPRTDRAAKLPVPYSLQGLPDLAILCEVTWRPRQRLAVMDADTPSELWEHVKSIAHLADDETAAVTSALATNVLDKIGGQDDISRGA
jgi:hypothetical protein